MLPEDCAQRLSGHVSTHAVADNDDAMCVHVVLLRVCRIKDVLDLGVRVFRGMCKGEATLHSHEPR